MRSCTSAASAVEGPWDAILRANIIGCYNVFEAARRNGVKRMLFATSNHAMGFYRRDQTIDHRVYPKPDSRYGVSKVFGEAARQPLRRQVRPGGVLHAHRQRQPGAGRQAAAVDVASVRAISRSWCQIGIEHPDIRFEIVYGVSGNKRSWYDNSNAQRLGYKPQDDSETYAAEVLAKEKPGNDPRSEMYQGGNFVVAEIGGDPSRVTPKIKRKKR